IARHCPDDRLRHQARHITDAAVRHHALLLLSSFSQLAAWLAYALALPFSLLAPVAAACLLGVHLRMAIICLNRAGTTLARKSAEELLQALDKLRESSANNF